MPLDTLQWWYTAHTAIDMIPCQNGFRPWCLLYCLYAEGGTVTLGDTGVWFIDCIYWICLSSTSKGRGGGEQTNGISCGNMPQRQANSWSEQGRGDMLHNFEGWNVNSHGESP